MTTTTPIILGTTTLGQVPQSEEGSQLPTNIPTDQSRNRQTDIQSERDSFFSAPLSTTTTTTTSQEQSNRDDLRNLREDVFQSGDGYYSTSHTREGGGGLIATLLSKPAVQMEALPAYIYGSRVASNLTTLANTASSGGNIAQVALRGGRLSQGTARVIYTARASNSIWVARAGTAGRWTVTRGLGRWIPILSGLYSLFDIGSDIATLGSMERMEGESEEEYQERRATQRTDTWINIGCTTVGAVIGFCLGGPIGACIGAGIGNLIGGLCKSGGFIHNVVRGIGRLFSGIFG